MYSLAPERNLLTVRLYYRASRNESKEICVELEMNFIQIICLFLSFEKNFL